MQADIEEGAAEQVESVYETEIWMSGSILTITQELTAVGQMLRRMPYATVKAHFHDLVELLQQVEQAGESLMNDDYETANKILQSLSVPEVENGDAEEI